MELSLNPMDLERRILRAQFDSDRYFWHQIITEVTNDFNGLQKEWIGSAYVDPRELILRVEKIKERHEFPQITRFYTQIDKADTNERRFNTYHTTELIEPDADATEESKDKNKVGLSLLTQFNIPQQLQEYLKEAHRNLAGINSQAFHGHRRGMTDIMGYPNRRALELFYRDIPFRLSDKNLPYNPLTENNYLLFIDLDKFKLLNDTAGHSEGDRFVRIAFEILNRESANAKTADYFVSRCGGDEFAIILAGATEEQAKQVIDNSKKHFSLQMPLGGTPYKPSMTIGYIPFSPRTKFLEVYDSADEAMYRVRGEKRRS